MKITKTNGFSLLELMIVLTIFGIMASTASFSWQRYANNANLRTAARQLASDISKMKENAISKMNTTYTISFNKTTNTYTMTGTTADGTTVLNLTTSLASFGKGSSIIFNALPLGGSTCTLTFLSRGTLQPTDGIITLKNNRGSSANIVFTITGKTYVTFSMQ